VSSGDVEAAAAAAAAARNKVLPVSSSPRWCSAPAPSARLWRRGVQRQAPVQESSASGSSFGEFAGFCCRGWSDSSGSYGSWESGSTLGCPVAAGPVAGESGSRGAGARGVSPADAFSAFASSCSSVRVSTAALSKPRGDGAPVVLRLAEFGLRRWSAATDFSGFGLHWVKGLGCNCFVFRGLCASLPYQL